MAKIIVSIIGCFFLSNVMAQNLPLIQQISMPLQAGMKLYPNPAKNKIELQLQGFEPGTVFISTFDAKGKTVNRCERMMIKGEESIIMFLSVDPGIYIVAVEQKNKSVRKKLVVQ